MDRTLPKLVGLSGYGETGKSEVAKYLRHQYGYVGTHVKDPMVEVCISLMARMGIGTAEALERLDGQLKNEPIPGYPWLSGRKMLQVVGKDLRDALGNPDKRFNTYSNEDETFFLDLWWQQNKAHPRVINESLRYPFEGGYFCDNGGVVIRIHVPGQGPLNDHPSETSIPPYHALLINYRRELTDLYREVEDILTQLANATQPLKVHTADDFYRAIAAH